MPNRCPIKLLYPYQSVESLPQVKKIRVAVSPAPKVAKLMEDDFIKKTLRERRTLQQALADLLVQYSRFPPGSERSTLARMIEILNDELAIRQHALRVAE